MILYKVLLIFFLISSSSAARARLNQYAKHSGSVNPSSRPSLAYPAFLGFLFLSVTLVIGVIIRSILIWAKFSLPYRVVIFAVGGIAGFCANVYPSFRPIVDICYTDIEVMLIVFLPVLVFHTSYNIEHHSFTRCFPQIMLAAVPGVIMTAFITAFMAYYMIEPAWTFAVSLLFGIVTTSIYPIEMVDELKSVSRGKYLSVLLLGEGLIGDVTIMISFFAVYGYLSFALREPAQICLFLVRYIGGGSLLGLVMGHITASLVMWMYTDAVCSVTITLSGSYLTYYIGEKFLYVSGLLATVIVGEMVSKGKSSLSSDVEQIMFNFWKIMAYVANTFVFAMAGVVIFAKLAYFISVRQVAMCLVTYGTVLASRLVVYATMMPVMRKVGYGMTWHKCMACVWGGLKGPLSLCLALIVLEMPAIADNTGEIFIIQTAGLVLLSLCINATTIRKVLRLLGLCEISLAKKANMTNCVKRIMATRDRCISMLKMDKFLADANWDLVHEGTTIKHPYKIQMSKYDEENDDDENYMGYRYTTCPDCEREIPNEPTKKEFAEMMREANQRVFKALKISYWRQYEHGKISKDGVKILVQAVDVAADSEDGRINLEALGTLWKPKRYAVWIRSKLVQMMTSKAANAQIPQSACRQSCYRTVTNVWFDVFIYVCIVLNTPVILYEVVMFGPSTLTVTYTIKILNLIFYIIYFFEMVIKMVALGVKGYFSSNWNKLDFFILVMATVDLILDIIDSASSWDKWRAANFSVVTATKLLRMLRFLRLFRLARVSVPKVMAYIDRMIDIQLAFGYDVGKGFVTGDQEVCTLLPQLVDNEKIQEALRAKLDADRLAVTRQLGLLQRDRPWTAITVKTRQATTATLNIMLLDAGQLKEEGFLDETEYKLLVSAIREKAQKCRRKESLVAPSAPETQLRSISWLQGIERVADFFIENSEILNFNFNDILISKGEEPKGLFILVSGLLEATYLPPEPENDEALPNYDFFQDLKFSEPCKDYIVSVNAVGVIGVLTNRPYSYTVRCDSAVQAYFIKMAVVKEAFNIAPHPILGLKAAMWREIGIKLSTLLLPSVPAYHAWSSEKLSMRLERAFVPCLKAFKIFVVNEMMEDILLLDGVCQDMGTHEIYKPPCYIPRTAHRLIFSTSSRLIVSESCPATKLLVIPTKETDEIDLMEDEVDDVQCELISNVSSRCLYHRAIRKLSAQSTNKPLRRVPSKRRRPRRVNYRSLSTLNVPHSAASLSGAPAEKEATNMYFGPANPVLVEESSATSNLGKAKSSEAARKNDDRF